MTNATVTKKSKNPRAPKLFPYELIDQLLAQVQGKDAESILGESGSAALSFIRPGKPLENACIESFNGRSRDECLNEHWFVSMRHTRGLIEAWCIEQHRTTA
ncbi:transposase [Burkholderia multivorans]